MHLAQELLLQQLGDLLDPTIVAIMSQIDLQAMTGTFSLSSALDHLELVAIRYVESSSGKKKGLGACGCDGDKTCDFSGIARHLKNDCFKNPTSPQYKGGASAGG